MLDAIFFYGIVMQNDYWPMQNFALAARITLDEILKMLSTSKPGYIVEVDSVYLPKIHEAHQRFPLAPSKLKINYYWLSGYKKSLKVQMHLPGKSFGPKLIPMLLLKKR